MEFFDQNQPDALAERIARYGVQEGSIPLFPELRIDNQPLLNGLNGLGQIEAVQQSLKHQKKCQQASPPKPA